MTYCPRCNYLLSAEKDNQGIFYKCTSCLWCEYQLKAPNPRSKKKRRPA